jgi:CheY-like chemotaxis protein
MDKKLILLGEDDKAIAEMYKIAFDGFGFKTVIAYNGEEVIEKAKEINPDVLLLDINMPIKDGFEVLKEASTDRALYSALSKTPIIMLTNYSNPQDINYCMKNGAQNYLVKSEWTPEQIIKKINKYII